MWISELNTKELTDPAYVAFDDGEDTYKTEFNECVENAANAAVAAADLTENEVAFTSGDAASPTAWSSVSVLTSGSTLATLFNRISTMIKNVRWLYSKLGTTDISSIGNGTVTGALSTLNGKLGNLNFAYVSKTVIIAAGSSNNPTFTDINFSDITGGKPVKFADIYLGNNHLPYFSPTGLMQTQIYQINGTTVKIANNTGAWTNYTLYAFIVY